MYKVKVINSYTSILKTIYLISERYAHQHQLFKRAIDDDDRAALRRWDHSLAGHERETR
jgi:hypothetical protein